jgi:hypothetical protein
MNNIFDLLGQARTSGGGLSLPVLNLWNQGTYYLIFFTLCPDKFGSHFEESQRSSYQCPGEGCPACAVGLRATDHIYLPVWDVQNRRVAVLKFHTGDDGPATPILSFLKTYQNQLADVIALSECKGGGKLMISAHQPLPQTDRGALVCENFVRGLENGTISLRNCVKRLTAAEIAQLPGVKSRGTPPALGSEVPPAAMESAASLEPETATSPRIES